MRTTFPTNVGERVLDTLDDLVEDIRQHGTHYAMPRGEHVLIQKYDRWLDATGCPSTTLS